MSGIHYNWIFAETNEHYAQAAELIRAYMRDLPISLDFQHVEEELADLPAMYSIPNGAILLLYAEEQPIATVGIRYFADGVGELKRMYIHPDYRGKQLGHALVERILTKAQELGYQRVLLDTLDTMIPAIRTYEAAGFVRIPAYYFNPEPNVLYFEWKAAKNAE